MTVFLCARCGARLTPELEALPAVPERPDESDRDRVTRLLPSTVPRGYYAIEAEPWGAPYVPHPDQSYAGPAQPRGVCRIDNGVVMVSAGPRGTIVVHPEDVPDLDPLPNGENQAGCCGPAGDQGRNLACRCGSRPATLAADCFGPHEVHLDALRVYPLEADGTSWPSAGWQSGNR